MTMDVVISAVGVVTPWGRGMASFLQGSEQKTVTLESSANLQYLPSDLAGLAPNQGHLDYIAKRKATKLMTPAACLAIDAVGQVLHSVLPEDVRPQSKDLREAVQQYLHGEDMGLFLSVGREPPDEGEAEDTLLASMENKQFSEEKLATDGQNLYPPLLPLKTLPNMILGHISILFGLCGENAAWAGEGVQSVWEGFYSIVEGRSQQVLVGATDSLVDLGQARDMLRLGIAFSPGQSAVAFLMESADSALQNNRTPLVSIKQIFAQPEQSTRGNLTDDGLWLAPYIGYCGVALAQLDLLAKIHRVLSTQETMQWNGLEISAIQTN